VSSVKEVGKTVERSSRNAQLEECKIFHLYDIDIGE